ncbi:MAG: DUF2442 domain-containing protein [Deltaproteobacteria bacterium]|nr:DUF2442 domain-containing protein [Deltaproteobacteria bacterium]
MNTSIAEQIRLPAILKITFSEDAMHVALSDGRAIIVPLAWYPLLAGASREELERYEISPSGYGVHWPGLDEDLSVLGFLLPEGRRKKSA